MFVSNEILEGSKRGSQCENSHSYSTGVAGYSVSTLYENIATLVSLKAHKTLLTTQKLQNMNSPEKYNCHKRIF